MKVCKKTKILAFVFLVASYAGMKRGAPLKTPVWEAIFLYTRRAFFGNRLLELVPPFAASIIAKSEQFL